MPKLKIQKFWENFEQLIFNTIQHKNKASQIIISILFIPLSIAPYIVLYLYNFNSITVNTVIYWQSVTVFMSNLLLHFISSLMILIIHIVLIFTITSIHLQWSSEYFFLFTIYLSAVYFFSYGFTRLKRNDLIKMKSHVQILRDKQTRLENVFDNEFYTILLIDSHKEILESNDTFFNSFLYDRKDIYDLSLSELIAENDRDIIISKLDRGNNFQMEVNALKKNGEVFPIEIISKEYTEGGEIYKICFIRDITHLKEMNLQLQTQKNYLQKILDAFPFPMYLMKVDDSTMRAANKKAEEQSLKNNLSIYGFNRNDWDSTHMEYVKLIKNTGAPILNEHEYVDSMGGVRVVEIYDCPILDTENNVIEIVETIMDISARKKAEKELRHVLRELQFMKNALDEHANVTISDAQGTIIYANDKFLKVSKYSREELIGRSHRIINSGSHDRAFFANMWSTIISGKIWQGEICNRAKDGSEYWVFTTIVPLLDESGVPYQYIAIRTNITERKQIEAELIQAKEIAEEANKAKSTFLANISHEIRTPLNGIIGMTELTLATQLSVIQNEYLSLIRSSGENLLYLINEILDFSKIEAGKLKINRENFQFRNLLRTTLHMFVYEARKKEIILGFDFDKSIPDILIGDPLRIKQILINLIGNALKFTDEGFVILSANLDETNNVNNNIMLKFSVIDSGIGISKKNQALIFESFTQEDSSTTRRYGGTGLGTTISKQLSLQMGGLIGVISPVENTPFKSKHPGSEFWFTIRVEENNDENKNLLNFPVQNQTPVLIVSDGSEKMDDFLQLLNELGFKVETLEINPGLQKKILAITQPISYIFTLIDSKNQWKQTLRDYKSNSHLLNSKNIVLLSKDITDYFTYDAFIDEALYYPVSKNELIKTLSLLDYDNTHKKTGEKFEIRMQSEVTPKKNKPVNEVKILVAEDNEVNQLLVKTILQTYGFQVTIANNGKIATEYAEKNEYDIIFMDLQMPEMNGYQATEKIRESISETIPIIAVTANAFAEDIKNCFNAGMNAFIAKPYKKEALYEVIEKWVNFS